MRPPGRSLGKILEKSLKVHGLNIPPDINMCLYRFIHFYFTALSCQRISNCLHAVQVLVTTTFSCQVGSLPIILFMHSTMSLTDDVYDKIIQS